MVMVGFRDTLLLAQSPIIEAIKKDQIGGVILYEYDLPSHSRPRNISSPGQVANLCGQLQAAAQTPLLIAIDEEGGKVSRLKTTYGFPPTVSAQYLGELNNVDSTSYYANRLANTLRECGINMNFAPVTDLNVYPECPIIGALGRSFSDRPEIIKQHAGRVIDAHHQQQILCAIKHFPGHGSAHNDSHMGFTDVSKTWTPAELQPFQDLIETGQADLVMTAHVFNQQLDPKTPATLSKPTIQGVLRDQLGWQGVVISDDLMMGAIADHFGLEQAIEKCILAGVDILLFSNNSPKSYQSDIAHQVCEIIYQLVEEEKIPRSRIAISYERILQLKSQLYR